LNQSKEKQLTGGSSDSHFQSHFLNGLERLKFCNPFCGPSTWWARVDGRVAEGTLLIHSNQYNELKTEEALSRTHNTIRHTLSRWDKLLRDRTINYQRISEESLCDESQGLCNICVIYQIHVSLMHELEGNGEAIA
jgi:hypothetical protein